MPATASMLNMHHHRAKFGCTLCSIGSELKETTRYYPIKKTPMTDKEKHAKCLKDVSKTKKAVKEMKVLTMLSSFASSRTSRCNATSVHGSYF